MKKGLDISDMTIPMILVNPRLRLLANKFGLYCNFSFASLTLIAVSSLIRFFEAFPFKTMDTVEMESPVYEAISLIVTFMIFYSSQAIHRKYENFFL